MSDAPERRTSLTAALLLLFVTAVWGSTFAMTKDVVAEVPVMDFLAVRFLMAAVVVAALFPRALRSLRAVTVRRGIVLGLLYGVAQVAQTVGLQHTAASVSGFVTGMYVVCTPILAWVLLREQLPLATWAAVPVATAGLAVLSLRGLEVGYGEAITLVAAVIYALHIVALGAWSTPQEAIGSSVVQLFTIAALGFVLGAPGGVTLPASTTVWLQVVYMAVFAAGLALLAQTLGAGAPPADPGRDHHVHRAGLRRLVRHPVRRRVTLRAAAARRRDRPRRDAPRRGRPASARGVRGHPPRGLSPTDQASTTTGMIIGRRR